MTRLLRISEGPSEHVTTFRSRSNRSLQTQNRVDRLSSGKTSVARCKGLAERPGGGAPNAMTVLLGWSVRGENKGLLSPRQAPRRSAQSTSRSFPQHH